MEGISALRTTLLTALNDHGAQNVQQELFDGLMVNKSRLSTLFDVGPRNAQEQKEVELGTSHPLLSNQ